ncbi:serine/threonine protein kinase [Hyalangium versicolor]|uniref:serine/threonine protein kinase n=1 Tax=Hyalangium versicolor TaxID=2861190 RepID=UPI001CCD413F|nr:serine/threonine-protein kinase [Hyalangium versicolor]
MTRSLTTPRRFGKYILIRKLAEGGMAEIYLAKQVGAEGFERDVVIKCMLDHFTQYREFIAMFLDEARLAARLHHPNIVQITDLGVADNRYFICMEYLAGEDLDAVIAAAHYKGQAVPIPIAARIMLSALEGLEFAHKYEEEGQPTGLVHRDISPSNIFVTYQGTVKVLDFGIAKASSRMTQTQPGLLKGKWGYMSPEQARGEPIDARSDLFSLGVTFHELLTARRVFQRDTEIGVLLALMAQPIPTPSSLRPEIPPALDQIVMRALSQNRDDRYASAAEMRAELEEFLRETPSMPGVSQLAQYMQGLFGAADVERKTKIPSLSQIEVPPQVQLQEDPVAYEKTFIRPSDPNGVPAVSPQGTAVTTGVAPGPAPIVTPVAVPASAPPARSAGLSMAIGALGAVALLALGGGAVWYFMRSETPQPVVVAPPVVVTPAPVVVPAPVPTPTPPAPSVTPTPTPAPTPAPTETAEQQPEVPSPPASTTTKPRPGKKPKPATVSSGGADADTQKVMESYKPKLLACAEKFRDVVPPRIVLLITVAASGKVDDVTISTPPSVAPGLASCMTGIVRGVVFPNKKQAPFQLQQPLRFGS